MLNSRSITKDQCKDTGMALVLLLLILYFIFSRQGLVIAAMFPLVITMTAPQVLRPLAVLWFGFSHLLGMFMSKVLLSLIFFGLVVPLGVIRRMMGRDALQLNVFKGGQGSVMLVRNHLFTGSDIEKPY